VSTTTETEFLGEDVPKNGVPNNGTAPEIGSDQEQGQFDEHDHDRDGVVDPPHEHVHEYVREDGTVSPLCVGGGCPTRVPQN
jgi:hypothetical protein